MASQYVTLDGGNTWMSPEQAAAKKGAAANLPSATSPQPQATPSLSSVQPSTQPQSPSLSSPTPAPQQSLSVPTNPGAINLNQTTGTPAPTLQTLSTPAASVSPTAPTAATPTAPTAPTAPSGPSIRFLDINEIKSLPVDQRNAYLTWVAQNGEGPAGDPSGHASSLIRLANSGDWGEVAYQLPFDTNEMQKHTINKANEYGQRVKEYQGTDQLAQAEKNWGNEARAAWDQYGKIYQSAPDFIRGAAPQTYDQLFGSLAAVNPYSAGGVAYTPADAAADAPKPLLNLQGSVTNPAQSAGTSTTPVAPQAPIPFKAGMSPAQQSSIQNLVSNKDSSQWNATDKANWSYATNNAPIPASRMSGSTYGTGSAAGASGASGSVSTGSSGAIGAMGSSANTGTSSGTSNYTSQYQSLLDKVLGELQKQPQQSDYEKQLSQLAQEQAQSNADAMQGVVDVRNQPIAQHFLTGQAAAIQRQADANAARLAGKAAPLQTLLGQEQARQKDYLSNLYQAAGLAQNEEQARQQAAQQQAQLAQQLAQQKAASGKPIEVSPGATIYDPVTGKALYTAPTAKSISGSSKVGGTSGGTGSAALSSTAKAVLAGTLRLEDLTPTERGKIAGELTSANYQSTPKLSAGQQEDIATMDTVSKLIDSVISYAADGLQGVGGLYQGSVGQFLSNNFGMGSPEELNVRQLIGNIRGTIAKLRGGTSFTASEQRLLDTYVPSIDESEKSVLSKLNGLKSFIAAKRSSVESTAKDRGVKESAPASNEYQNYLNSIK